MLVGLVGSTSSMLQTSCVAITTQNRKKKTGSSKAMDAAS